MLRIGLDQATLRQGHGSINADYGMGIYLMRLPLLAALVLNSCLALTARWPSGGRMDPTKRMEQPKALPR